MRRFTQGRGTREMTAGALQNAPPRLAYQRGLQNCGTGNRTSRLRATTPSQRHIVPEPGAPRAVPVRPAPSDGPDGMNRKKLRAIRAWKSSPSSPRCWRSSRLNCAENATRAEITQPAVT